MEVYVAPFGEAVAEMTVAQLKLATSVDHLVCVGEKFDRHLWSERWKRLPGSHDPSWLDWLRGGRHATTLELRRAAQRLQRELSRRLEREITWEEDVELSVPSRQALSDHLALTEVELRRLAARLGAGGEAPSGAELEALLGGADAGEPDAAVDDPKHAFVQLSHLRAGSVFVPAEFDEVLEGVPFTIGSAPSLAIELDRLRSALAPSLADAPSDELARSLDTLARLTREAIERRLPLFASSEVTVARAAER
jgi:hypothetical protein